MKSGKVWGETELVLQTPFVEFHRIWVHQGGFCSLHKHVYVKNRTPLDEPIFYETQQKVSVKLIQFHPKLYQISFNAGPFNLSPVVPSLSPRPSSGIERPSCGEFIHSLLCLVGPTQSFCWSFNWSGPKSGSNGFQSLLYSYSLIVSS